MYDRELIADVKIIGGKDWKRRNRTTRGHKYKRTRKHKYSRKYTLKYQKHL